MATVLDELFVRLGFRTDAKALEGYAKNVEGIKQKMEGLKHLGEAYLGFEGLKKVGEFVKSAITGMADIQEFSERVDLAATDVAALGRVATENGSSLEGMEGTIASLNATLGQAASGFPRAEKMLSRFGLKAKDAHGQIKTFDQMLGEVADKMEGTSTGKRLAMANALGIDQKLIPLLKEGSANFARLRDEAMKAGAFKDSDYERAHESEKLFSKAEGAFLRLKQRLAIGLLPTVNELLKKFTAWVSDSKNIARIQGYIESVVKVAKLLWENAGKIAAVFAVIYAHKYGAMFLDWGVKLMAVAKGLAAANGATELLQGGFAALKGILAGGLIAALVLVAEDLWVFYRGGTSVTGWLLTKFPYAVQVAQGALALLSGAMVALATGSGPLGLLVVGIGGLVIAAKDLYDNWGPVAQWFGEIWDGFLEPIASVLLPLDAIKFAAGLIKEAWDPVVSWLGKAFDWWIDKLEKIGGWVLGPLRMAAGILGMKVPEIGAPTGTGKTRAAYAGMDEDWFNQQNSAFNNRTNKGLGALAGGGGNMLTWGAGTGAARAVTNNQQRVDNSIKIGEVHVHEAANGAETWDRVKKAARDQTRTEQTGVR
jgi:hypothetical protein